jgi:hypothetical protein
MNYLKELDQTKHLLDQILDRQKASNEVKRLLLKFHDSLITKLNLNEKYPIARTNVVGISYLCNSKKAFLFLNVGQKYLTAKFFTGDKSILGIEKGIWINKNDNLGSQAFRISNETALKNALDFSAEAFNIAVDWSR